MHWLYHGIHGYLPWPRTRRCLVSLPVTAAYCSDSAQSKTQQLQSHLPHCLQACLVTRQWLFSCAIGCIKAICCGALQQPDSWWSRLRPGQGCNPHRPDTQSVQPSSASSWAGNSSAKAGQEPEHWQRSMTASGRHRPPGSESTCWVRVKELARVLNKEWII